MKGIDLDTGKLGRGVAGLRGRIRGLGGRLRSIVLSKPDPSPKRQGQILLVLALVAAVGALYMSYKLMGLVNTIAYALAFLAGVGGIPSLVGILGGGVPFNVRLGRGHIVLGAFAFGHHYLVQRESTYEWWPGTDDKVWIDGIWHDIDGAENKSVFGWRPFGILRYKGDKTLSEARVDTKAERDRFSVDTDGVVADGGEGGAPTRGAYEQVPEPIDTGLDGRWIIDLKRVFSRGVAQIGDIELIETAEEIIERGQVNDELMGSYRPFIETLVGIIFGIIAGYLYVFLA